MGFISPSSDFTAKLTMESGDAIRIKEVSVVQITALSSSDIHAETVVAGIKRLL
jgi:hypothetical protein